MTGAGRRPGVQWPRRTPATTCTDTIGGTQVAAGAFRVFNLRPLCDRTVWVTPPSPVADGGVRTPVWARGGGPVSSSAALGPGARSSMDRASDYGSEGWGFESLRAHSTQRHPSGCRSLFPGPVLDLVHELTRSRTGLGVSREHQQHPVIGQDPGITGYGTRQRRGLKPLQARLQGGGQRRAPGRRRRRADALGDLSWRDRGRAVRQPPRGLGPGRCPSSRPAAGSRTRCPGPNATSRCVRSA